MDATASVDSRTTEEAALEVGGMDCASCVAHVEKALRQVPGVESAQVNLARGRASVRFDPAQTDPHTLAHAVSEAGYPSTPETPGVADGNVEEQRLLRQAHAARAWFRRAAVGILLWLPLEATHWALQLTALSDGAHAGHSSAHGHLWMHWAGLAASTVAIAYVGWAFYRSAWAALVRRTSNMDTLIAMGASVAYGYSLV